MMIVDFLWIVVYFSEVDVPNSNIGARSQVPSVLASWVTDLDRII